MQHCVTGTIKGAKWINAFTQFKALHQRIPLHYQNSTFLCDAK